jgi:hypothetical protein
MAAAKWQPQNGSRISKWQPRKGLFDFVMRLHVHIHGLS